MSFTDWCMYTSSGLLTLDVYIHCHLLSSLQGMSQLPDYNKIGFPNMPPIPLDEVVPDASKEVGLRQYFSVFFALKDSYTL